MMLRFRTLVTALLLGGCASANTIPEVRSDERRVSVQTNTTGTEVVLSRTTAIASNPIAAPPEKAWAALPGVLAELGIEVTGIDTSNRLIRSDERMRRVDGKSPGAYFDCPGAYSNLAASGVVFLALQAQVLPGGGDASILRVETRAAARQSAGMQQTNCTSKDVLEKLITRRLQVAVGEG